jgi:hypothetical protein
MATHALQWIRVAIYVHMYITFVIFYGDLEFCY